MKRAVLLRVEEWQETHLDALGGEFLGGDLRPDPEGRGERAKGTKGADRDRPAHARATWRYSSS